MQTTIFIISIVVILFIAVISILITKKDTSKGEFAELKVKELADKLLNANEYRAIHNVTVKTLDGTT